MNLLAREIEKDIERTIDIFMVVSVIAIFALFFQVPYLMPICAASFWILGIFSVITGVLFLKNTKEMAANLVSQGIADIYIKNYDKRYKQAIFWASWVASVLLWLLFYIRGHVWLVVLLASSCALFEIVKRRIRKELTIAMAASFIYNVGKILKGE